MYDYDIQQLVCTDACGAENGSLPTQSVSDLAAHAQHVLTNHAPHEELLEAALTVFHKSHPLDATHRGAWVRTMVRISTLLWEQRETEWIKQFNETAVRAAWALDAAHIPMIVHQFIEYARWDDNPADFHLTTENFGSALENCKAYIRERLEAGKFSSEEEFLRWMLRHERLHQRLDPESKLYILDVARVQALLQRLEELGADCSAYDGYITYLLEEQLAQLQVALRHTSSTTIHECFTKAILTTQEDLCALQ